MDGWIVSMLNFMLKYRTKQLSSCFASAAQRSAPISAPLRSGADIEAERDKRFEKIVD